MIIYKAGMWLGTNINY